MRILINCPSGESRLLQVSGEATVLDLKQLLHEEEGIPISQQVLCFAGQHLKDHLSLQDHGLEEYTLSDEVVLYLSSRLATPQLIYLCARSKSSHKVAEIVEADLPVGEVKALLESRMLAGTFDTSTLRIYVKREDGSTVPIAVDPAESIAHLEERLAEQEKVAPERLTFSQAQDGNMHIQVHPSAMSSQKTFPVYKRAVKAQMTMPMVEPASTNQPLPDLIKELCVLP